MKRKIGFPKNRISKARFNIFWKISKIKIFIFTLQITVQNILNNYEEKKNFLYEEKI